MCDIDVTKYKVYSANAILNCVCEVTGYNPDILKSRVRKREVCEARHAYFALCKELLTDYSYSTIGNLISRSHSDVIHGCNNKYIPKIARIVKTVKQLYFYE